MAFEAILIPTLFLTHLAKPAQLLQAFGLDSVRYLQMASRHVSDDALECTSQKGQGELGRSQADQAPCSRKYQILLVMTSQYVPPLG